MKKLLTLTVAMLVLVTAQAQQLRVGEAKMLAGTEKGGFYHPVFSPSGDYLLTSTEDYTGLTKHNLNTGTYSRLTDAPSAGYGVRISSDGKTITYRHRQIQSTKRMYTIEQINVTTADKRTVRNITQNQKIPAQAIQETYITTVVGGMMLYLNGSEHLLQPNGADKSYFWASVSPDQKHIVYVVAQGGTWVADIDGSNPVKIGHMRAPQWFGNDRLIGMFDIDNGEHVVRSYLVTAMADGSNIETIPTEQPVAMYPTISADGKHIAFNTLEGQIFIMEVLQ